MKKDEVKFKIIPKQKKNTFPWNMVVVHLLIATSSYQVV